MHKYLIIIFLLNGAILSGQEWMASTSLPAEAEPRHHPVAFALNGYGYVGTGSSSEIGLLDDFWRFDPVNETWEAMPPFPGGARSFAYGVTYGNKAYVGFGRNDDKPLNDLWEFDPDSDSWTELDTCLCAGRTHPALVAANGHVYVGLGGGGGNKKDWWAYNIESGNWEERDSFPSFPRHHPFQFEIDDYAYVGMGHGEDIYNDLYKYDHNTDSWEAMTNLPGEGRVAGTEFGFNGKGYVLSGEGDDHDYLETGEFWEYDPILNDWNILPPHPGNGSRWAPGNFVIDNTIFFMAGQEDGINQKDMMSYTFETGPSSVSEASAARLEVFPNPVREYLDFNDIDNIDQVMIYSFDGKELFNYRLNRSRIDLSAFNPGVYFIQIKSRGEMFQSKFIKL